MNWIKLAPSILRIGGLFVIFGLGWYSKGVLVENRELKQLRAQLEASNSALVRFQREREVVDETFDGIREELNSDQTLDCNAAVPQCITTLLERMQHADD